MPGKLTCPFCSTKMDIAELMYITNCGCPKCHLVGDERIFKRLTALQKKLDTAMGFLKNTAAALKHAGNMGALASNFDDVIKEIEETKE